MRTKRSEFLGVRDVLKHRTMLTDTILFAVSIAILLVFRGAISPVIHDVTLQLTDTRFEHLLLPAFKSSKGGNTTATMVIDVPAIHATWYAIQVDDCLQELIINGLHVIPIAERTFCSPHEGFHFPLGNYLSPGKNIVSMTISDIGTTVGIDLRPSPFDALIAITPLGIMTVTIWYIATMYHAAKRRMKRSLLIPFFVGAFIRLMYVFGTSYSTRAHDADAHIDYIRYMFEYMKMPPAAAGWEFHQAPLYYGFMATFMHLIGGVDASFEALLPLLQGWSLLFSVVTLGGSLLILDLMSEQDDARTRWIGGAIIAFTPASVFFASRITNEGMSTMLGVLSLYATMRWWKKREVHQWSIAMILAGIGAITKISLITLFPLLLGLFALRYRRTLRLQWKRMAMTIGMIALIVGWLPLARLAEDDHSKVLSLGNIGMDQNLSVDRSLKHMTMLNPIGMIQHPFNDSWSDEARRDYALEYFFRSAFFGEYQFEHFRQVAPLAIFLAFLLLIPGIVGFLSLLQIGRAHV